VVRCRCRCEDTGRDALQNLRKDAFTKNHRASLFQQISRLRILRASRGPHDQSHDCEKLAGTQLD
jgi:hypothetical protein